MHRKQLYVGAPIDDDLRARFGLSSPEDRPSRPAAGYRLAAPLDADGPGIRDKADAWKKEPRVKAAKAKAERLRELGRAREAGRGCRALVGARPSNQSAREAMAGRLRRLAVLREVEQAGGSDRARMRVEEAAFAARMVILEETRKGLQVGPLDCGVASQHAGRVVVRETEGGSHTRIRRSNLLHDRRVSLPDDLRAAGLELEDLAERAARLGAVRSCLNDAPRGGGDPLIRNPRRSAMIAAANRFDGIAVHMSGLRAELPAPTPWTRWDVLATFIFGCATFAAAAGKGPGARKRVEALRGEFIASLRVLRPLVS